jgi:hypothetical protein
MSLSVQAPPGRTAVVGTSGKDRTVQYINCLSRGFVVLIVIIILFNVQVLLLYHTNVMQMCTSSVHNDEAVVYHSVALADTCESDYRHRMYQIEIYNPDGDADYNLRLSQQQSNGNMGSNGHLILRTEREQRDERGAVASSNSTYDVTVGSSTHNRIQFHQKTLRLSAEDYTRARAYYGNVHRLMKFVSKLRYKSSPTKVVVCGGSITLGHGVEPQRARYGEALGDALNEMYPVARGEHMVYMKGAHGADVSTPSHHKF